MYQVVFNEISAAELSSLSTLEQLHLLDSFKVDQKRLDDLDEGDDFGKIERDGKTLFRYRTEDYRIYFEVVDGFVTVHRVLSKNTLSDFFFRSGMPLSEDEILSQSPHFWKLINEGSEAKQA